MLYPCDLTVTCRTNREPNACLSAIWAVYSKSSLRPLLHSDPGPDTAPQARGVRPRQTLRSSPNATSRMAAPSEEPASAVRELIARADKEQEELEGSPESFASRRCRRGCTSKRARSS